MDEADLEALLKRVPMEQRATTREFAVMSEEAQLIWLYSVVTDHSPMEELRAEIAELRAELAKVTSTRGHIVNALYTTGAIVVAIVAAITGRIPMPD